MPKRIETPRILMFLQCEVCGFAGTPLSAMHRHRFEGDDILCGSVDCHGCGEIIPVEIDAVHDAQHACLVALGEE